jgi:GTPase SAR1 family protein
MRKARGLQAQRAFNEALLNGATQARTLKVMFVGQGRAGKTSTLKALTGQPFRRDEKSTHGMTAGACEVSIDFLEQWNVVEKSEAECFRASFDHAVSTVVANKLKESESAPPDSVRKIAEQIASSEDFAAPVSAMPVDLIRTMIDEEAPSGGENEILLQTWDFGGQREYYVMHHLFLTNRGLYLVVLDLELWLRKGPDGKAEDNNGTEDPALEALTFWLSSIHVHAPEALIVIVGTHLDALGDAMEATLQDVEDAIQTQIDQVGLISKQLIVNQEMDLCFFPVDNAKTSDGGESVQRLQIAIDQVVKEVAETGFLSQDLPLRWVRLQGMALKAGPRGPRSEARGCAGTTGFAAGGPCAAEVRMA